MTIHTPLRDDRYTDMDVEAGALLLEQILAELAAEGIGPALLEPMQHQLGFMRGDNIRAVIVQEGHGGWVTDALFRDVPRGCPESYGTADASPFGTRQAARKAAVALVRGLFTQPIPAEVVAWTMAGQPDCGLPILIGDKILFTAYRH